MERFENALISRRGGGNRGSRRRGEKSRIQKRSQRGSADAGGGPAEELAAGEEKMSFTLEVHLKKPNLPLSPRRFRRVRFSARGTIDGQRPTTKTNFARAPVGCALAHAECFDARAALRVR